MNVIGNKDKNVFINFNKLQVGLIFRIDWDIYMKIKEVCDNGVIRNAISLTSTELYSIQDNLIVELLNADIYITG